MQDCRLASPLSRVRKALRLFQEPLLFGKALEFLLVAFVLLGEVRLFGRGLSLLFCKGLDLSAKAFNFLCRGCCRWWDWSFGLKDSPLATRFVFEAMGPCCLPERSVNVVNIEATCFFKSATSLRICGCGCIWSVAMPFPPRFPGVCLRLAFMTKATSSITTRAHGAAAAACRVLASSVLYPDSCGGNLSCHCASVGV